MKVAILLALIAIAFGQNYTGTWFVDYSTPTVTFNATYPGYVPSDASFAEITQSGDLLSFNFVSQLGNNVQLAAFANGTAYCYNYFCRYFTASLYQGLVVANYTIVGYGSFNIGHDFTSLMVLTKKQKSQLLMEGFSDLGEFDDLYFLDV